MIEDLKHIEQTVLMDLLKNPSIWNTLDVNYHPPRVERLFTQIEDYRLMIHIIHPCTADESLYHPHPWPSAIHVLSGKYEMGLGMRHTPGFKEITALRKEAEGWEKIPIDPTLKHVRDDDKGGIVVVREICRLEMEGNNYYSMIDPLGWHSISSMKGPCVSFMLIGKPFDKKDDQDIPKEWGVLPIIEDERKLEILEIAKDLLRKSGFIG